MIISSTNNLISFRRNDFVFGMTNFNILAPRTNAGYIRYMLPIGCGEQRSHSKLDSELLRQVNFFHLSPTMAASRRFIIEKVIEPVCADRIEHGLLVVN